MYVSAANTAELPPDRTIAQSYPVLDSLHVLSNISSFAAMRPIRMWISLLLFASLAVPSSAQE